MRLDSVYWQQFSTLILPDVSSVVRHHLVDNGWTVIVFPPHPFIFLLSSVQLIIEFIIRHNLNPVDVIKYLYINRITTRNAVSEVYSDNYK